MIKYIKVKVGLDLGLTRVQLAPILFLQRWCASNLNSLYFKYAHIPDAAHELTVWKSYLLSHCERSGICVWDN